MLCALDGAVVVSRSLMDYIHPTFEYVKILNMGRHRQSTRSETLASYNISALLALLGQRALAGPYNIVSRDETLALRFTAKRQNARSAIGVNVVRQI